MRIDDRRAPRALLQSLLPGLLLVALALPGSAQTLQAVPVPALSDPGYVEQQDEPLELHGLVTRLECAWPEVINKGWFPARLQLRNLSEQPLDLKLTASQQYQEAELTQTLHLEPFEVRRLEILLPAFAAADELLSPLWWFHYRTETWNDSDSLQLRREPGTLALLIAREQSSAEGMPAVWAGELSAPGRDWSLAEAAPDALSNNSAAYSSLDAVLLAGQSLPPAEKLQALLTWTREGGVLVYEAGLATELEALADVAAFREPRFALALDPRLARAGQTWRFGLGTLVAIADLRDSASQSLLVHATLNHPTRTPRDPADAPPTAWLGLPVGLEGALLLPAGWFALTLFLFFLISGPINFWIVLKRLRRPALLLLTIPAISLAFSLLLLLVGLTHLGLGTRAVEGGLVLLDQRAHRATLSGQHQLLAGRGGRVLRPAASTTLFAHPAELSLNQRAAFEIKLGEELRLGGAFLPVRQPVTHVLQQESTSRVRLEFHSADSAVMVTSGLEASASRLVYRDAEGAVWALDQPLEPGASAMLQALDANGLQQVYMGPGAFNLWLPQDSAGQWLPRASYACLVPSTGWFDACGLELERDPGWLRVLGLLALDAAPGGAR